MSKRQRIALWTAGLIAALCLAPIGCDDDDDAATAGDADADGDVDGDGDGDADIEQPPAEEAWVYIRVTCQAEVCKNGAGKMLSISGCNGDKVCGTTSIPPHIFMWEDASFPFEKLLKTSQSLAFDISNPTAYSFTPKPWPAKTITFNGYFIKTPTGPPSITAADPQSAPGGVTITLELGKTTVLDVELAPKN